MTVLIDGPSSPYGGARPVMGFVNLWEQFGVQIRAASQNHISDEHFYGWRNRQEWFMAQRRLENEIEMLGITQS